jgi:serine/threonine protein kinase
LPFWAESELEIDLKAKNNPIDFKANNSPEMRDIIEKCCHKNPLLRPTIDEILHML